MTARPDRRQAAPVTVTDHILADILDELRTISAQLVQEPADPDPADPRLVSEPAPKDGPK